MRVAGADAPALPLGSSARQRKHGLAGAHVEAARAAAPAGGVGLDAGASCSQHGGQLAVVRGRTEHGAHCAGHAGHGVGSSGSGAHCAWGLQRDVHDAAVCNARAMQLLQRAHSGRLVRKVDKAHAPAAAGGGVGVHAARQDGAAGRKDAVQQQLGRVWWQVLDVQRGGGGLHAGLQADGQRGGARSGADGARRAARQQRVVGRHQRHALHLHLHLLLYLLLLLLLLGQVQGGHGHGLLACLGCVGGHVDGLLQAAARCVLAHAVQGKGDGAGRRAGDAGRADGGQGGPALVVVAGGQQSRVHVSRVEDAALG
mmetsp:Transcript_18152/g.45772  ORF Transcript_18152/g.45772 Transcript_18152/m.45772 type:complete len:313 (+) Transcript_18152:2806-3744(+)